MLEFKEANIRRLALTWVGNKGRYEGVSIPNSTLLPVDDMVHELLITTLVKPFQKNEEFYTFTHDEDVSLHPVYQSVMNVFSDEENLAEEVKKLTNRLYASSENPRFKGGEFFVAIVDNLLLHGEECSALALLKVNNREPFFRTDRKPESFALMVREGIPMKKPELAALIFNLDEVEGYRIAAVDTVSKKDELSLWKDDFLRISPMQDHYFNTQHYMGITGEFITQKMPISFKADRPEQIDMLNRSAFYFKENEHFDVDDYTDKIFEDEEKKEAFKEFRNEYAQNYNVPLDDQFDISNQAVRKQLKIFKSVIKLDKNFHIYVHGRRDWIERGFDEDKGMRYYKVFFEDEE